MRQLSGANIIIVDDRPEVTEKVIQISGTPEQAERAQSLLQGFILSSKYLHLFFLMTACDSVTNGNNFCSPFAIDSAQEDGF